MWEVRVDAEQCPAMVEAIAAGKRVRLARMIADPRNRKRTLQAIPLLLRRGNERQMLPDLDSALKSGDSLLFCGRESARSAMAWIQRNAASLDYVTTGDTRPQGWVWRAFSRRPRRPRDGEV
ncbi:MAG: hypothetical protein B0D86_06780 [Candidatus Sedimenticola endophacoides]|nr:MAG: hypothetical protein B0D86_06780 [Candidatus Sedimenticola endophacoides]